MNIFRVNGKFRVETRGGHCNRDHIPSDTLQLGRYAPVSVMQWREETDQREGRGTSVYAMFRARLDEDDAMLVATPEGAQALFRTETRVVSGPHGSRIRSAPQNDGRGPQFVIEFLVCDYRWNPGFGYSWEESREELVPLRSSPVLGESYEIDVRSLEIRAIPHPIEVAA